jgi:hypothetical protein
MISIAINNVVAAYVIEYCRRNSHVELYRLVMPMKKIIRLGVRGNRQKNNARLINVCNENNNNNKRI